MSYHILFWTACAVIAANILVVVIAIISPPTPGEASMMAGIVSVGFGCVVGLLVRRLICAAD